MQLIKGNIFDSECDAICNAVNTFGISGAGIALEFKNRYPVLFSIYKELCSVGLISVGKPCVIFKTECDAGRHIVLFPTKHDWRYPSKLEWIEAGLEHLDRVIDKEEIKSIGFPLLGTGLGGLKKEQIIPLIEKFEKNSGIVCKVYEV